MFFFFSSRRRHTRSTRDWSSDVCSSDLDHAEERRLAGTVRPDDADDPAPGEREPEIVDQDAVAVGLRHRSEERRVGKECRSRRSREHSKKNTMTAMREAML